MARAGNGPSIRMVADAANVSVATVSNVINGKTSVAPEIAARVQAAVERLGYVRDNRAARLRSGKSRLAGVIVPDLTNPMFAAFVSTLEHLARCDGYDLVVVSARNDPAEEAERLRHIRGWRPAGLIVHPLRRRARRPAARGARLPMVVADRIPDVARFDLVAVDNAAASAAIVRHLDVQGFGDCLVVGTSLGISNVRERWQGALSAAGGIRLDLLEVGFDDHAPPALADRLRGGAAAGGALLPRPRDHARGLPAPRRARPGRRARHRRSPASTRWSGCGWSTPALTAVRQPVEEMAECAWTLLRAAHRRRRRARRRAGGCAVPSPSAARRRGRRLRKAN